MAPTTSCLLQFHRPARYRISIQIAGQVNNHFQQTCVFTFSFLWCSTKPMMINARQFIFSQTSWSRSSRQKKIRIQQHVTKRVQHRMGKCILASDSCSVFIALSKRRPSTSYIFLFSFSVTFQLYNAGVQRLHMASSASRAWRFSVGIAFVMMSAVLKCRYGAAFLSNIRAQQATRWLAARLV